MLEEHGKLAPELRQLTLWQCRMYNIPLEKLPGGTRKMSLAEAEAYKKSRMEKKALRKLGLK